MPTQMPRGTLIAIEGIDGAGKRTQLERLTAALDQRGIPHFCISFPRYDSFFGQLVARYLNGEFGPLTNVDPHFSALLYAGDRLEAKSELETALADGRVVLADRYIGSNLAHQGARVPPSHREEYLNWLRRLEYTIYALPAEDLVIYLRLPAEQAQRLIDRKSARSYTPHRRDLHEADLTHLHDAAQVYDRLAREPNWIQVECFDPARQALRSPDEIHQDVLAAVSAHLLHATRTQKQ
ncbi:MAG: thymidylate kinase [Acidobacteriia bacterium]|nr:thymidylate kinase [Terriglobia bacterium]